MKTTQTTALPIDSFFDTLPTWLSADVVVCGGGTSGAFAAIAAADEGADVLVIERGGGISIRR